MILDTVIRGGTLITPGGPVSADLGIVGEQHRGHRRQIWRARRVIDATGMLVLPGAIDPHVHLQMPAGAVTSSDDWQQRHHRGGVRRHDDGDRFCGAGGRGRT